MPVHPPSSPHHSAIAGAPETAAAQTCPTLDDVHAAPVWLTAPPAVVTTSHGRGLRLTSVWHHTPAWAVGRIWWDGIPMTLDAYPNSDHSAWTVHAWVLPDQAVEGTPLGDLIAEVTRAEPARFITVVPAHPHRSTREHPANIVDPNDRFHRQLVDVDRSDSPENRVARAIASVFVRAGLAHLYAPHEWATGLALDGVADSHKTVTGTWHGHWFRLTTSGRRLRLNIWPTNDDPAPAWFATAYLPEENPETRNHLRSRWFTASTGPLADQMRTVFTLLVANLQPNPHAPSAGPMPDFTVR